MKKFQFDSHGERRRIGSQLLAACDSVRLFGRTSKVAAPATLLQSNMVKGFRVADRLPRVNGAKRRTVVAFGKTWLIRA